MSETCFMGMPSRVGDPLAGGKSSKPIAKKWWYFVTTL
jgi:hypothetical protein